ncbi:hypothetical protein H072_6326 [Dactylellina haptotyla CBS 200.50]|uniref:Uncharacterized protein n=1 Tax=Dactylellina haptotyla (strain CBS 200.50) TaxID=1284197 RepID=S8AA37_DACHA|nr:hypothetical protein H072_6326 [Dactylellina haptotyla CBS 200.50]
MKLQQILSVITLFTATVRAPPSAAGKQKRQVPPNVDKLVDPPFANSTILAENSTVTEPITPSVTSITDLFDAGDVLANSSSSVSFKKLFMDDLPHMNGTIEENVRFFGALPAAVWDQLVSLADAATNLNGDSRNQLLHAYAQLFKSKVPDFGTLPTTFPSRLPSQMLAA